MKKIKDVVLSFVSMCAYYTFQVLSKHSFGLLLLKLFGVFATLILGPINWATEGNINNRIIKILTVVSAYSLLLLVSKTVSYVSFLFVPVLALESAVVMFFVYDLFSELSLTFKKTK